MNTQAPTDDATTQLPADQPTEDQPAGEAVSAPEVPTTIEPDATATPAVEGSADDGVATAPEAEVDALSEFEQTPAPVSPVADAPQSMFDTPAPVEAPVADADADADTDTAAVDTPDAVVEAPAEPAEPAETEQPAVE